MATTVAFITYQYVDNPNNYDPSWIAEAILDPPNPMPEPWITVPFETYTVLLDQQKANINQKSDEIQFQQEADVIVNQAFTLAWSYIFTDWDIAGLLQLVAWLFDPNVSQEAKDYIVAVNKWKDAVMYEYLMNKKPRIKYGYPYDMDYSFIGPSPCKFTDIFLKARPEFTPPGYVFPDITNYNPGTRENPWQY